MRTGRVVFGILLVLSLLPPACWGQQEIARRLLGTDADYLLNTDDVLALPDEETPLRATIEATPFLGDAPEVEIRFRLGETFCALVRPSEIGRAETSFTPRASGDYVFEVTVAAPPEGAGDLGRLPGPTGLLVACREPDAPIIVCDLDDTVIVADALRIVPNAARALPGSLQVLTQLARDHTIVYLTFRPGPVALRTKSWLASHGYPRGPLLVPDALDLVFGNRRYKSRRLQQITCRFDNVAYGIGDKISDVEAYDENGVSGILILNRKALHKDEAEDYFKLAGELHKLSEGTQVVYNWDQIRAVIYNGARFPIADLIETLTKRGEALEAAEVRERKRKDN